MRGVLAAALVMVLVASIGFGVAAAVAAPTTQPLDVFFYSQYDSRWRNVAIGFNKDVKMMKMGSLLTAIAMVADYHGLQSLRPDGEVTPEYINAFLAQHEGYRPSPPKTVIIDYDGLLKAFTSILGVPGGMFLLPQPWPAGRAAVDHELDRTTTFGGPSILILQVAPNQFHPVVAVGWDPETESYFILDPDWENFYADPTPMRVLYGSSWQQQISGALIAKLIFYPRGEPETGDIIVYPLISVSTKSPVETIAVDPDGRRVGFDVATGTTVVDVAGASYMPQPVWADPTDSEPVRAPGRLLTIPAAADGRYRVQMIATGDGPFTLSVRARNRVGELTVNEFVSGTVKTGDVLKFQIELASNGPSFFTTGDNFKPEADAGGPQGTTIGKAVVFPSRSFDIDDGIASYQWDFGDGSTGTGQTPSHAYASAGTYIATLTVTDHRGATGTDTAVVSVFDPQATSGRTERVSVATNGTEAAGTIGSFNPALSADGRFVAFESYVSNLGGAIVTVPNIYVRDRQAGATQLISPVSCVNGSHLPVVSDGARLVAFECLVPNPTTGTVIGTILVVDRLTGAVERADVSSTGEGGICSSLTSCGSSRPAITPDGRFVVFYSEHTNLVPGDTNDQPDVFVRDRVAGTTERVSVRPDGSQSEFGGANRFDDRVGISADGRFVAFASIAGDLVSGLVTGTNKIFVRDRQQQVTELINVSSAGVPANGEARQPSISADGRIVAFSTLASNLVPGDTNGSEDAFVRDRVARTTERVSLSGAVAQAVCPPGVFSVDCVRDPVVSADGRFVVFRSRATNLILNDANAARADVFIRDRVAGTTELVSQSTEGEQGNSDSGDAAGIENPTRMAVSADGRFVAFVSAANNLVSADLNGVEDIFVRDRRVASPVADASGPYLGWATTTARPAYVAFDASRSLDPTGHSLVAQWNFGDGTPAVTTDAATPAAHAYATPGTYTVTLVVSNGAQSSAPVTTLVDVLPPLVPALSLMPACGRPGDRISVALDGYPLVALGGGFNLGRGPLPAVRTVHPGSQARVNVLGLIGGDPVEQLVPIEAFSAVSALEFSTRFSFTVGAGWSPGMFTVSAPDEAAVSAGFTVPCPALANEPPRANVGGPYQGTVGMPVTFDGRASADPEGAPLTYTWYFEDGGSATGPRPSHTFNVAGTYVVLLRVNDGQLNSPTSVGTRSFTTVTIAEAPPTPPTRDTTPPTTVASASPGANAKGWNATPVTITLSATDNVGGSGVKEVRYSLTGMTKASGVVPGNTATVTIPAEGTTTLKYYAVDYAGNQETAKTLTIRVDRTAPVVLGLPSTCSLWPPDHRLVQVASVSARDAVSGLAGPVAITVTSNEPTDSQGDGHSGPDIVISGGVIKLRAERSGTGSGRIYTITVTATDIAGNIATKTTTCTVPHDQVKDGGHHDDPRHPGGDECEDDRRKWARAVRSAR